MEYYEFVEPHITEGISTVRVTKEQILAYQKKVATHHGFCYNTDEDAIEDFCAVHYANKIGKKNE